MNRDKTISLAELDRLAGECDNEEWFHPRNITGIDFSKCREHNRAVYERRKNPPETSDDEIIVDYLFFHLSISRQGAPPDIREIVDAAMYLVEKCWSVSAALRFGGWHYLLTPDSAKDCLLKIMATYEVVPEFVRYAVRENVMELFQYQGEGPAPEVGYKGGHPYANPYQLSEVEVAFLDRVFYEFPPASARTPWPAEDEETTSVE